MGLVVDTLNFTEVHTYTHTHTHTHIHPPSTPRCRHPPPTHTHLLSLPCTQLPPSECFFSQSTWQLEAVFVRTATSMIVW